jgi:hypothetical protein
MQNNLKTGLEKPSSQTEGPTDFSPIRKRRRKSVEAPAFLKIFWIVVAGLIIYGVLTSSGRPALYNEVAALVGFLALIPSYLWCSGKVPGLPIFPLFSASFIITHALQFIISYQRLQNNTPDAIWNATLTVCGFLLLATFVWRVCALWRHTAPLSCRVLRGRKGEFLLLLILAVSAAFAMADHGGWLAQLSAGVFTALRGFIRGLTSFTVFVLAMRWGAGKLGVLQTSCFVALFISFCVIEASSLFLVGVISVSLMLLVGYAIGRKSVPIKTIVAICAILSLLHVGKGMMREKYWGETQGHIIQPTQFLPLFGEWVEVSLKELVAQRMLGEETVSIFARANTIDLLLQAQRMSPDEVAFLHGETYAIIPDALIPRLFHPGKASPHDSTSILNVAYGNQTWESAQTTSIGWGMLNESFANFGYIGVAILAIILGAFYGLLTRWSVGLPLTSLPSLVGIFTMAFALQTEMTAAIFVTAYAQGLFALLVLAWLFAERRTLHRRQNPPPAPLTRNLRRIPGYQRRSSDT